MMSVQTAYKQYKEVQVKTANKGKLLIMLYQGAIKFMRLAKTYIRDNNISEANENLIKAQNIVNELNATLDQERGGEIARNLSSLYNFMNRRLIEANIKKEIEPIEEVEEIMMGLLESWEEIINKNKSKNQDRESNLA